MHTYETRRDWRRVVCARQSPAPAPRPCDVVRHPLVCRQTDKESSPLKSPRGGPVFERSRQRQRPFRGVAALDDAVASVIGGLPGVATLVYGPGDRLPPDHLDGLLVIRDGAIVLRVSTVRSVTAIVEIFGPDRLLS